MSHLGHRNCDRSSLSTRAVLDDYVPTTSEVFVSARLADEHGGVRARTRVVLSGPRAGRRCCATRALFTRRRTRPGLINRGGKIIYPARVDFLACEGYYRSEQRHFRREMSFPAVDRETRITATRRCKHDSRAFFPVKYVRRSLAIRVSARRRRWYK